MTDRVIWDVLEGLQHLGTCRKQHQKLPNSTRQILCMEVKFLTPCTLHGHTHTQTIYFIFKLIQSFCPHYKLLCIHEYFKCDLPRYVKNTHLRVFVDLLGVGAGRFEAGQHLQQVKQRSEVRLLEEQQHGDVLLLGRRQTGGRQLDAFPLSLPSRSSQRHKHHLGSNRQTWRSDDSPVLYISNHRTTTRRVFTQSVVRWTETIKNKCRSGMTKKKTIKYETTIFYLDQSIQPDCALSCSCCFWVLIKLRKETRQSPACLWSPAHAESSRRSLWSARGQRRSSWLVPSNHLQEMRLTSHTRSQSLLKQHQMRGTDWQCDNYKWSRDVCL